MAKVSEMYDVTWEGNGAASLLGLGPGPGPDRPAPGRRVGRRGARPCAVPLESRCAAGPLRAGACAPEPGGGRTQGGRGRPFGSCRAPRAAGVRPTQAGRCCPRSGVGGRCLSPRRAAAPTRPSRRRVTARRAAGARVCPAVPRGHLPAWCPPGATSLRGLTLLPRGWGGGAPDPRNTSTALSSEGGLLAGPAGCVSVHFWRARELPDVFLKFDHEHLCRSSQKL